MISLFSVQEQVIFFHFFACLVKEKFKGKTFPCCFEILINFKDCSERIIRISVPNFLPSHWSIFSVCTFGFFDFWPNFLESQVAMW
jgi:hypothetical protein